MVSAFRPGGKWPATSKPSCIAISAPSTPLSAVVLCTISLGVQFLRPAWPKTSPISRGGSDAAATAGTVAGAAGGGGLTGLAGLGAGVGGIAMAGAAGAGGVEGVIGAETWTWVEGSLPLPANTSGMWSVIVYFFCDAPGRLCARKIGAMT